MAPSGLKHANGFHMGNYILYFLLDRVWLIFLEDLSYISINDVIINEIGYVESQYGKTADV